MKLADKMNAVALRLIKKYGYAKAKAKLIQQVQIGNSWENNFKREEFAVNIIIVPSPKYSKETAKINGKYDFVESTQLAFIADREVVPTVNDIVKTDKDEYTIQTVVKVAPDGTDIVYKLELK